MMPMQNIDLIKQLTKLKACQDCIEWVKDNKYSLKEAWEKCERADWLLWYMVRTEMATKRERIHIICDCAATALKYIPKGEDRPRLAIEAARKYADNPSDENLSKLNAAGAAARDVAGDAAWAAAGAAARDVAGDAAWAAAGAAARDAAWAAAGDAARDAAGAAARDAAGDAAWAAAGAAARDVAHINMCKMIRRKIKI